MYFKHTLVITYSTWRLMRIFDTYVVPLQPPEEENPTQELNWWLNIVLVIFNESESTYLNLIIPKPQNTSFLICYLINLFQLLPDSFFHNVIAWKVLNFIFNLKFLASFVFFSVGAQGPSSSHPVQKTVSYRMMGKCSTKYWQCIRSLNFNVRPPARQFLYSISRNQLLPGTHQYHQ